MNAPVLTISVPSSIEVLEVRLERRRVHHDEHVGRIARRVDLRRREVQLESRHAEQAAGGRADLGGKVRERRDVVASFGGRLRELGAGQLHAVAGVTGEPDDDAVQLLRFHRVHLYHSLSSDRARGPYRIPLNPRVDRATLNCARLHRCYALPRCPQLSSSACGIAAVAAAGARPPSPRSQTTDSRVGPPLVTPGRAHVVSALARRAWSSRPTTSRSARSPRSAASRRSSCRATRRPSAWLQMRRERRRLRSRRGSTSQTGRLAALVDRRVRDERHRQGAHRCAVLASAPATRCRSTST